MIRLGGEALRFAAPHPVAREKNAFREEAVENTQGAKAPCVRLSKNDEKEFRDRAAGDKCRGAKRPPLRAFSRRNSGPGDQIFRHDAG